MTSDMTPSTRHDVAVLG